MMTREQIEDKALEVNKNVLQSALTEEHYKCLSETVNNAAEEGKAEIVVNFGETSFKEVHAITQYLLVQGFTVSNVSSLDGDCELLVSWA